MTAKQKKLVREARRWAHAKKQPPDVLDIIWVLLDAALRSGRKGRKAR